MTMPPAGISLPSPLSPASSSRKRLLSDLKTPNLSPPSDLHRRKNPRHLPNLSDCHACHRHITDTNPKHRLETLESLWRIVLLCKHCMIRVRKAESCSYCFSPADESDSHRCRNCLRRIHRECAVRYSTSAPWSYCKLESRKLGFIVCVDCWLPKSFKVSNRVCNRNKRNGMDLKLHSEDGIMVLGNGEKSVVENRVCESEMHNGLGLKLQPEGEIRGLVSNKKNVVENGDCNKKMKIGLDLAVQSEDEIRCSVERRNVAVTKAKEKGMRKAVLAKRALEFADGAMRFARKKSEKVKNECLVGCDVVFDDAELAVRLHRMMNSSPRISRSLSLGNHSGLAVQSARVGNGDSLVRPSELKGGFSFTYKRRGSSKSTSTGPTEVCTDSKFSEDVDAARSEPSVCGTPSEGGDAKHQLLVYRRKCKKCSEFEENGESIPENDSSVSGNQPCHTQGMLVYKRKCKKCNERQIKDEILVYRRKCKKEHEYLDIGEKIPENSMGFEDQGSHTQDVLVYRRKCKKEHEYLDIGEKVPEDSMSFESLSCHTQDELVYRQTCEKCNEIQVDAKVIPENGMGFEDQVSHTQCVLVYRRKCKKEHEHLDMGEKVTEDNMSFECPSCHTQDELVYRQTCEKCHESQVDAKVIPENSMGFEDQVFHKQDLLVYRRKCKKEDECLEIGGEL